MNRRPISISIIAWYLLISAGLGAAVLFLTMSGAFDGTAVRELMERSHLSVSVQYLLQAMHAVIVLACGLGMLSGQSWSRLTFVAWSVAMFLIQFVTSPMPFTLIPGLVIFALIAALLYRPAATRYFIQSQEAVADAA